MMIFSFHNLQNAKQYGLGGLSCREGERSIGEKYQALPKIQFVYLDPVDECRYVCLLTGLLHYQFLALLFQADLSNSFGV